MSDPRLIGWKDEDGNNLYQTSTDFLEFAIKAAPVFLVMLLAIFFAWWFR